MMSAGDPRLEVLCRNAAFVVEQLGPLSELETFGLDAVSVAWVEGFIERQRARLTAGEKAEGMAAVLGSYLGEAIIAASSGCWDFDDEHGLGIHFPKALGFRDASARDGFLLGLMTASVTSLDVVFGLDGFDTRGPAS